MSDNIPNIIKQFFIYTTKFATLAAGASANNTIQIQADANFAWLKGTFQADIAGAAQTDSSRVIPAISLLITDTGSGRQLMDAAVPVTSFFGDGRIPFILPEARIFAANSNISITATNLEAANTYNLRLAFIGYKLYRAS